MTVFTEQVQSRSGSKNGLLAWLFIFQAAVAGLFFPYVGWAELFSANLLVGAFIVFAAVGRMARGNVLSTLLASLSAMTALTALICWSERGMNDAITHWVNGVAAILLLLFLLNEKYGAQPWLPKTLSQQPGFAWALGAQALSTAGIATGLFITLIVFQAFYRQDVTLEAALFPPVLTLFMLLQCLWVNKHKSDAAITQLRYLPYTLPLQAVGTAAGIGLAVFLLTLHPQAENVAGASAMLLLLVLASTTATLVAAEPPAE